jgi:trk system potassium uptake protein TrkH
VRFNNFGHLPRCHVGFKDHVGHIERFKGRRQFLLTAALCAAVGTGLRLIPVKKAQMHSRDGFVAVALSWVLLSLFGALPYVFTGAMTSYIDALFETVSGLTTTGSSTFTAVSHLPRSVLLWRSLHSRHVEEDEE